ncbi:inorganic polyphosphate/ATP-NAD kinase [Spiroplasma clarkii]|uniref:NAD(+)/NADH kinase n=1 Tax=Spiroplasma clarkii TaxID=2139 RepID=UPI000B54AA6E|nr:NAD(+)/NADH kinase [Spiroplasma clarkii]ARU92088.1 inorganic polyphosphate/ATP-NAD kinase [Spiroplasma clarkii]
MFKFFIVKNDYKVTAKLIAELEKQLLEQGNLLDDKNPDYVFVIGGDGTFLKAVHLFQNCLDQVKFIPFKSGGIGFYTNRNNIQDIQKIIAAIKNQQMQLSTYEVLEISNKNQVHYCCNEVKILNEKNLVYIKIFLNDEFFETFHGTGLVISTANGSTGYMKSTGGAVIFPKNAKIYQLQELVPVSTNKYRTLNAPLILNNDVKLKLELSSLTETLLCDTQERKIMGKELTIKISDKKLISWV